MKKMHVKVLPNLISMMRMGICYVEKSLVNFLAEKNPFFSNEQISHCNIVQSWFIQVQAVHNDSL